MLVPPNRYRPLAKIGEEVKEHPQNVHLTKIIESNMKIRLLQHGVDTYAFQKELIQSQNEKAKSSKEEVCVCLRPPPLVKNNFSIYLVFVYAGFW